MYLNKTIDAQVQCPYYLRESTDTVSCEGIIEGTDTLSRFRCVREKRGFMKAHCLDCTGKGCEIADYFNRKYG